MTFAWATEDAPQAASAPADTLATCPHCYESVRFVEGLRGPQRWVHVRTGDWQCHPVCKHCGQSGTVKIGHYDLDGGQMPMFRYSHHECNDCCKGALRIEHT